jgi:hypothetical protein
MFYNLDANETYVSIANSNPYEWEKKPLSDVGLIAADSQGNVGLGVTNPPCRLHVKSSSTDYSSHIYDTTSAAPLILSNSLNDSCALVPQSYQNRLSFQFDNNAYTSFVERGYIKGDTGSQYQLTFTGQHRNLLNKSIDSTSAGLIVSSTGKYVNLNNSLSVTITESLPICALTTTDNDKKVFGVISDKEDEETTRTQEAGAFVTPFVKTNQNERRMFINSLGEGGIWVCNKNGALENGDYITSSSVPGYGMKQTVNMNLLANHTVAKITCDCDFSITKIIKQKLKVIITTDDEKKSISNIDYDAQGNVQYEDDLDSTGTLQMVYNYDTRFLQPDGTQITEDEYTTKVGLNETVYIACFVGCTYHCG